LRISPELYLKRLLVGGFTGVYEINRNFRNEGISRKHNPEFTMLELYQAYADYTDMMQLTEALFANILREVYGAASELTYQGTVLKLAPPFARRKYHELFAEHVGFPRGCAETSRFDEEFCAAVPSNIVDAVAAIKLTCEGHKFEKACVKYLQLPVERCFKKQ
jgi:lysyl-tRNA synthetase class II